MSDLFKDNISGNKRSIRDIPIPTKEEKEAIDTEAVREDKETAKDNIQNPRTIHHSEVHRLDGMKSIKKATKRKPSVDSVVAKTEVETESVTKNKKYIETEIDDSESDTDVLPLQKKDLRKKGDIESAYEIEPAFTYKSNEESDFEDTDESEENKLQADDSEYSYRLWRKRHKKGFVYWFVRASILVALFALISSFFVSAHVRIVPKKYDVTLESAKLYLSDVTHKTIEVNASESIQVTSKGVVKVDRKATGTVVLYNSYSSSEQKLVANTRIETSDGKIFRLDNPTTIPGQKTVNGKKIPGSTEAKITADKTGDDYNVGFKDFKITAYKGTDKYEKIYARSKTGVGNGYSGEVPNISQNEITAQTSKLKEILSKNIETKIKSGAETLTDYIFVPDSYIITYTAVTQKPSSDGTQVTLSASANATAILFNTKVLSKEILKTQNILASTSTSAGSKISYTGDISKIKAAFPKDTLISDITSGKNAYFTVTGTSTIYSSIDSEIVSQAISHLTKNQAIPVVKELVDSDDIQISIWPWWIRTLPTKKSIQVDIL